MLRRWPGERFLGNAGMSDVKTSEDQHSRGIRVQAVDGCGSLLFRGQRQFTPTHRAAYACLSLSITYHMRLPAVVGIMRYGYGNVSCRFHQ